MQTVPAEIFEKLKDILIGTVPPLIIKVNTATNFEVAGTKEVTVGKKKVGGMYFCTIVLKPKDVRFYFFPNYTHAQEFANMSAALKKCLKGKSCFHFKSLDKVLENEVWETVMKGLEIYKRCDLI